MSTTETGTSIAQRTETVVAQIQSTDYLEQLRESLPENVTLERFKRVTITAVRSNPDLATADQGTLFGSIVKCAQDGLLPDGREAALVIYSGKVQYLPMIGGYRKIAADHGWTLQTQTVRQGDEFDFEEGLEPHLVHRRAQPATRGELVNAYAIAQHRDGRKLFVVLDQAEIAKCREVSKAKDKSGAPWTTWTERMWEKTAGKRLFKQLPLGNDFDQDRLERMLAADRATEQAFDDPTTALYGPNGETFTATEAPPTESQQAETAVKCAAVSVPGEVVEEGEWAETGDDEAESSQPFVVKGGLYEGQTLAEVAATTDGVTWIKTQLKRLPADDARRSPIEGFVAEMLPDTWAGYVNWKESQ